jgi:uncharacterized membrane protein YedE/YeeE
MQKIQRSERERPRRKPRKSQIPAAIILTVLLVLFGIFLSLSNDKLPAMWLIGIAFGIVLQRSRFCFTASVRDPVITGSTSLTRAVLVAFAIGTIGFTAIKYGSFLAGGETNLNMVSVNPIGGSLALGAILFGVGMVISGGCASGTLMRVGEGFTLQMIALIFFVIGSLLGAHDKGQFWDVIEKNAPSVFLPDIFGWAGALLVQGLIIFLLYMAAIKWQKKKIGSIE